MKLELLSQLKKLYVKYTSNLKEEDKQRYTAYIFMSLTLFTVGFLGLFAIGPTLNTVSNLDKQYKDNMIVYEALHKKFTNLQVLDTEYQKIEAFLPQIYAAIPKDEEIPKLTRQIENIAKQNNLFIRDYTVGTVEIFPNIKSNPIYSFNFTVDVSGRDTDVNKFIADIIKFDRIVGIDKLSTGHTAEGESTASLTCRAFFGTK